MSNSRESRPARPQVVLQVLARREVSAHLVSLTLGGPGFADFVDKPVTDRYVKLLFAKPELGLEPPYDMEALRERLAPEDMPVRRTYTVRRVNPQEQSIDIEFVVHGDEGIAGPWARNAQTGDTLCFVGPAGIYAPDPSFDRHLLVGDETAIPAIGAALESMDDSFVATVLLEVAGPEDEIELPHAKGVDVRWVHRGEAFSLESTILEREVRALPWPEGRVQIFAHGEREVMKNLRRYFHNERGVERRDMSLSAYWAFGRAEDAFQAEKRTPIGQIFEETPIS